MAVENLVHCYNKGCGKQFKADENTEDSCVYHSGAPVFHEGYKSWSCCEKKTTDFTEFLNIKGCCKGSHSHIKPVDPTRAPVEAAAPPPVVKPPDRMERPGEEGRMIPLPSTISTSLKKLLNKLTIDDNQGVKSVAKEAICQRKGCGKAKCDCESANCLYHPGCPVFHEGMKYWSCCTKRTTDFNEFLEQKGCTEGTHLWADPSLKKEVQCRYDWHQTGDSVNFTVYAKKVKPDLCSTTCNAVKLNLEIHFGEDQVFTFNKVLAGIIEPENSKVTFSATKVEVSMRKAEFVAWPSSFVL